ncbi:MAG: hypothetical protein ACI85O_003499, partial [Saprospiraceae bacterium]
FFDLLFLEKIIFPQQGYFRRKTSQEKSMILILFAIPFAR